MRKIFIPIYGEKKRLAEQFGCTYETVRKALKGEGAESDLCQAIRREALKIGFYEPRRLERKGLV